MVRSIFLVLGFLSSVGFVSAQTIVKSITHGGISRTARVYVPPTYSPANPAPLVFNLHGYTSNAQQQEFYSEMNNVADTAGFIAVYPEGVAATWNSGLIANTIDDVGFISVLIDSLNADYNIDLTRVYSCGMSMGGFMSYRLACDLDDRIAAIASVTGLFANPIAANCNASRPVPVLQIHGTADGTVPYNGTANFHLSVDSTINFWRNFNNCTAAPVVTQLPDVVQEGSTAESYYYGGCQDNTEVMLFKLTNHGHAWPGALPIVPGITNQDIEGSVEIWKFFLRHSHPNPIATARPEAYSFQPRFYPQPAGEQVTMSVADRHLEVTAIDLQGREMGQWNVAAGQQLRINVSRWAAGIYLAKVSDGALVETVKLVVD